MQKTLSSLITSVEQMLYNSAGPSVQVYSQDIIAQKLNQAFDRCFHAKMWPQFLRRETRTLDGATGKTTAPFTYILEWGDVQSVFREYSNRPLQTMPESFNILSLGSGGYAKFIEPSDDDTLFTIYPLDATGQISVVGRASPSGAGNFALSDTVPFDYLALEYLAAWEMAIDDASNGGMAAKFQTLFDSRMKQLEDDAFDNVVLLAPNSDTIPMEWR
jgi:hypothetical protein